MVEGQEVYVNVGIGYSQLVYRKLLLTVQNMQCRKLKYVRICFSIVIWQTVQNVQYIQVQKSLLPIVGWQTETQMYTVHNNQYSTLILKGLPHN